MVNIRRRGGTINAPSWSYVIIGDGYEGNATLNRINSSSQQTTLAVNYGVEVYLNRWGVEVVGPMFRLLKNEQVVASVIDGNPMLGSYVWDTPDWTIPLISPYVFTVLDDVSVIYAWPLSTNDDAVRSATTYTRTSQFMLMGRDTANNIWQSGVRFPNIVIPIGKRVKSATLRGLVAQNGAGTPSTIRFHAHDVDNAPIMPASGVEFDSLVRTSAYSDWVPPSFLLGEWVESSDISTSIKAVTSRPGFVSGNAIALFASNTNTTTSSVRSWPSRDNFTHGPIELRVVFEDIPAPTSRKNEPLFLGAGF
jgi:hypothetical protein